MTSIATVGFIGTGNMGSAIIRGLSLRDDVALMGYDTNRESLNALEAVGLDPAESALELAQKSDYVVIAVKPQDAGKVISQLCEALDGGKCLISICAGLTMKTLRKYCKGACPVVRVMPNTPAMVGAGVFAVCLDDEDLSEEQRAFAAELFTDIGDVHILDEKHFDAFTAVAGSGPAYVFYFMDAIIEAAVTLGLPRPQATQITESLFTGSSKLAAQSEHHICKLREMVTSPAGTTIEATNHLDRKAVRGQIIKAVMKSAKRSRELG